MAGLYILAVMMTLNCLIEGGVDFCFLEDPCNNGSVYVLDIIGRSTNCPFYGRNGLCDSSLTETWYRTETPMTNTCPSLGNCGTYFPVWLNGAEPEQSEGMVYRNACMKGFNDCCAKSYDIVLKNCSTFMAYCLQHTTGCAERYCFGDSGSCPTVPPSTTTTIATTTTTLPSPTSKIVETGDDKPSFTIPVIIVATVAVIITISCVFFIQWIYRNQRGPGRNNDRILVLAHGDINVPENDCGNNPWIMGRDMQTLRIHDLTEEYVYHIPNGAEGGVPPVGTKFPNEIQKTEKKRKRRRSDVCPETEMYPPE